ncbi:MAG: Uma2 family endonuclease [Hyphomonadaceae bacterium]
MVAHTLTRLQSSPSPALDGEGERVGAQRIPLTQESDRHLRVRAKLQRALNRALDDTHLVVSGGALRLAEDVELRPDLHVFPAAMQGSDVRGKDVSLAVEVCCGTAEQDFEVKIPIYAAHGVPEVWVLDLETQRAVIFRRPSKGGYLFCTESDLNAPLQPSTLPNVTTNFAGLH